MATIDVKDAGGATVAIEKPLVPGRAAAASSRPVALSTEDLAAIAVLGASGDAASLTTTIKAALRGIATALGITALDLGSGTGGTRTLRVSLDSASSGIVPTDTPGSLTASGPSVTAVGPSEYETVAASQTAQVLGPTGATGDYIQGVLVVPATTSPGNVLLLDNATSITIFAGGASSVSNLIPFFVPLGMRSVSGAWKLTTGANVSCIGVGAFT